MAEVEAVFVSAGCNRTVKAASWGPCGLVAFAAHHSVAIFCPQRAAILTTLSGHKDNVNCVEWLPRDSDDQSETEEHFLLSGSADGAVILWAHNPSKKKWEAASQIPTLHGKSVTCISCTTLSSGEAIFASSASDGEVRVWSCLIDKPSEDYAISLVDTISMRLLPVVTVTITRLPGSSEKILLATGSLDNHVHLYVGSKQDQFLPACKLKGHIDWIRGLDFSRPIYESNGAKVLFLASSSQDRNIRIWKLISRSSGTTPKELSLKSFIEGPVFRAGTETWQVSLESLLVGHEDWVYSVCWEPGSKQGQPMSVLSSSMDKTMMVWRPDAKSGIWMNEVTVGELGHSALGFYGGVWSPTGDGILAHGFNGSFHLWKDTGTGWSPQLVPSGHFGSVVDVSWAKKGQFLLTASHDQTTRVFINWNKDKENPQAGWHEVARPQVHGHDLNCLAVVQSKGNHQYVSGAEEKVARVFEAPSAFLDTLTQLTSNTEYDVERGAVQILGANMSALGLSQKPIYTQGEVVSDNANAGFDTMEYIPNAVPTVLNKPPLEEQLAQNTLWPESHKLYGHGNELFSMCSNHAGDLLATACKAQTSNVAEIWLWETKSWRPVTQLRSHSLTVTQMAFSHNDRFLLSVSRDRHLSVFQISQGVQPSYKQLVNVEAHKRIVWTCSWSPSDSHFATGSRDKVVKIWSVIEGSQEIINLQATLPTFKSSVTALAWGGLLAVGMESGQIELWNCFTPAGLQVSCLKRLDTQICHAASVNRLCWRKDDDQHEDMQLVSCGADHTMRLFSVRM